MRKTFLKKAREALQEMRAQLLRNVQEELHEGREQTKDEGMDTYDLASAARGVGTGPPSPLRLRRPDGRPRFRPRAGAEALRGRPRPHAGSLGARTPAPRSIRGLLGGRLGRGPRGQRPRSPG